MRSRLNIFIVLISLLLTCGSANAVMAIKSDKQRVCDVIRIAEIVEKFKDTKGHYPYEEAYLNPDEGYSAVPVSVNFYRRALPERYQYPPPGVSGYVDTLAKFESYLSEALSQKILLPVDGRVVDEKSFPTFYQFMFDGNAYYVAAILESPHPDARKLANGHYKYQVSSISAPNRKIKSYESAKNDCDR